MNNFLKEAIRIGDQLLAEAEHDAHGLSWKTANINIEKDTVTWSKADSIYSGSAGIILFFIELYRLTKNQVYLKTAEEAMQWTLWYCQNNPTDYYALFTGRMGTSFACLKLYEQTKKATYLTQALEIAKPAPSFLTSHTQCYDLINGYAGTLLGLLHLHAATKEPWVLEHIALYTKKLLERATLSKRGIYWESGHSQIKPLCGFSHGSSGIGFVFLELAYYFANPAFTYIAEQAFLYEATHFDKQKNNWVDLRLNMYDDKKVKEYESDYLRGELTSLTEGFDMSVWCHGAPGIGLARLRWAELSNNPLAQEELTHALQKAREGHRETSTLCHGFGGNAEIFIESSHIFKKKELLSYAQTLGNATLEQKKSLKKYIPGLRYDITKHAEDRSLFNGIAGIGYFLLRLTDSKQVRSILAPTLQQRFSGKTFPDALTYDLSDIKHLLLTNIFARTVAKIEQFFPKELNAYLKKNSAEKNERDAFVAFLKELLPNLSQEQQQEFDAVFTLELRKITLFEESISSGYIYIKNRVDTKQSRKTNALSDTQLQKKSLILSPLTEIQRTNNQQEAFLLRLTPSGTVEFPINTFCAIVLTSFMETTTVAEAIQKISTMYNVQTDTDKQFVTEKVIAQIREALKQGILYQQSKSDKH